MTRKVTLTVILILLIVICYELLFGTQEIVRNKISGINDLKTANEKLNTSAAELENLATVQYDSKKQQLKTTIEEYKKVKQEYDDIIESVGTTASAIEQQDIKDIYDVDFLWTIIGNFATEEGVVMTITPIRNTTSASSLNNTSGDYIIYDLKFDISGNYVNLTDFIYDLEDDDRLNFEINDFEMKKNGDLAVSFTVKEVKINATNLITSQSNMTTSTYNAQTQTIDSNSTNTSDAFDTTSQTNTTNTTNSTTVNNNVN